MKCHQFLCGVVVCVLITIQLISCQKESIDTTVPESVVNVKETGLEEDDPALVSKVPMIMSADFSIPSPGTISNGKPVKGGKGDLTAPDVSIISPANGAAVTGSVKVAVSATDNVGVSSV